MVDLNFDVAPEVTNINCIKSFQVGLHGVGKNFSVNVSLLYVMNCLSPLILVQLLVLKVVF